LKLNIQNETSRLKAVILGTSINNGPTPQLEDAYDPKSIAHIKAGTYPKEKDMVVEMEAVVRVFEKYNVEVYRPKIIQDCNQIFARDIAVVIEDRFIKSNILPDREEEIRAIQHVIDKIDPNKVCTAPEEDIHFEGGDIMIHNNHIFIGTYKGDKAIIHKAGFRDPMDYEYLLDFFGKENLFHIDKTEMYQMNSNIFSIAEDVVISERNFTRLNAWLRSHNIKEAIILL